jgi:RNA-directed DNA polymerase
MTMLEQIAEPENLRLAFLKASRGKQNRPEVIRYRRELGRNLFRLRGEILGGAPGIGDYRYFTVHDPKRRTICAASFRERILHHAVMNLCEPVLERAAIFDSYACRKGKGQFACLERAQRYSRGRKRYLKLDVKKYFDSIHHGTLKEMLAARFLDAGLVGLFDRLINSYATAPGRGLPIGNLCSQHFANFYLGRLDRYVKEVVRCPGYVRYMDDFVLWHDDAAWLRSAGELIAGRLEQELKLEVKPPVAGRSSDGLNLLGFRVKWSRKTEPTGKL